MIQRHMPMGYRIVNGKAEIVPEAADTVKQVFQAYLSGISTSRIAKELNAQGVLNASHKASWNHGSVGNLLKNQKYQGDEFFPPLIAPHTFEAVQERRREKSRRLGRTIHPNSFANQSAFSSRLVCGICGQPYRKYVEHCNQPGEKINWKCKCYIQGNRVYCRNLFLSEGQISAAFLEAVNRLIDRPQLLEHSIAKKQQSPNYRVDRISEQIQEMTMDGGSAAQDIKKLIFERAKLQYQTANIEDTGYWTEKLKVAIGQREAQTEFNEPLFLQIIKQVVIFDDGRLEFHFINGLTINTHIKT